MIETPETCEAYIRRCQSWSNRIHSGDFPDDIRAVAINDVCSKFDSFTGEEFKNNFPKPFARLFIMHLADFDHNNQHFETNIPATELKNIYLEWHSRHLEAEPAN